MLDRLRQRVRSIDALFGAMATLFGLQSLAYPFGRDQGLFYYAAREWLLRGQVLYRDVWDHKPPIIYFIHMLAIRVLGEHTSSIRVFELAIAVPALGWATARIAARRGQAIERGAFGAAWLGVSVVYYGYNGFWETGQCEIWAALFAALALAAALQSASESRGNALAGALSAIALFTKPPMIFFVLVTAGAVVVRARERPTGKARAAIVGLCVFAGAGSALGAAILAYFAARHALSPMLDILIGANATYVDLERGFNGGWDFLVRSSWTFAFYGPFSSALLLAAISATCIGIVRSDRSLPARYGLPVLLALAGYATGAVQLKFYAYHWITIVVAQGVFVASAYSDLECLARERGLRWLAPTACALVIPGLFVLSGPGFQHYAETASRVLRYEAGLIDREEYTRTFDAPLLGYAYHDAELTGNWLRQHSTPRDTVVVRGFEPEIYAISGRHYTGRFFWTMFLTAATRAYKRDQWLAEDLAELRRRPPRYAVTQNFQQDGVNSAQWFERLGYRRRAEIGVFSVLERVGSGPPAPPSTTPPR